MLSFYVRYLFQKLIHYFIYHVRLYLPWYIYTRYPAERSKMTTLMRIFTPLVWFLVSLSILTFVAFFKFGAYIGKKYGLRTANEEIALYPLR